MLQEEHCCIGQGATIDKHRGKKNEQPPLMISNMRWYDASELPKIDEESIGSSEVVAVTFDGETISTLAVYDYEIEQWFSLANGEYRIMGEPSKWAYAKITPEEISKDVVEQDIKTLMFQWFMALEDEGVDPWEQQPCVIMAERYHYTKDDYDDYLSSL